MTLGNFGRKGKEGVSPVSIEIVDDLIFTNGANGKGLLYSGPEMNYKSSSIELLGETYSLVEMKNIKPFQIIRFFA